MITPKVAPPSALERREAERTARTLVMARDEGLCVRCRRINPLWGVNHDHRKNRSQGGNWSPENGQLLCGTGTTGCHGWVTDHPAEAVAEGWAVPGWADPADWPARRWLPTRWGTVVLGWVLYNPDGTWMTISSSEAYRAMHRTVT